ncbi:MAG TPA: carbohydrate ABC transporter permease [Geminicoccus sp.]|uniref:carbohydrate ABC transporter permease n=1 Tax=Geminicoccus sp. TaxID=2024832 RepID=UPI002E371303|nr:carbohydrate ABC transporter permease [Geminicoccus sp.]HEX2524993.1 carbohydrate ABC transporter permease [Geminicoccus sp.]
MTDVDIRVGPGRKALTYLAASVLVLFTLFPIYILVISSLKGPDELFTYPPSYWPDLPTLENYIRALSESRLVTLYLNSLLVAAGACSVTIAMAIFAGFAMARFEFSGRSIVIALFLLAQIVPQVVMLIPVFSMFKALALVDSRFGLLIVYVAMLLPFSVIMMRGFYLEIPVQLEEAAMIDGCSRLGALLRVVLPAALPGLVATTMYGFINSWNELLFAVILINSPKLQTLPVGIMSMVDEAGSERGLMLAVAVMALVPSLVLFGWIQRYLTSGLAAGAMKG